MEDLKQARPCEPIHAAKVFRIAEKHKKAAGKLNNAVRADNKKLQQLHNDDPIRGVKSIGKKIDAQAAPPLEFVKRDGYCTDGGAEGSVTTSPQQIDGVVTRAWRKIYQGNVANAASTVANFIKKFWKHLYVAPPHVVEAISAGMVWGNFQAIEHSAVGMDGWEPLELKLF